MASCRSMRNRRLGHAAPNPGESRLWRSEVPSGRWRDRLVCFALGEAMDEGERAGLLAPRSSYSPRLSVLAHSGIVGLSSLVTAAQPFRIYTRFPILP